MAGEEDAGNTGINGAGRGNRDDGSIIERKEGSDSTDSDLEKDVTLTTASPEATATVEEAEQFDSRVTICKPDFIDRVAFNETSDVSISVDGSPVQVVVLVQLGLYPGSCVVLDAEVGAGWHTIKVEPLRAGEPYVAISHVVYPA